MSGSLDDIAARGYAALKARDWATARDVFTGVASPSPEITEGLGESLYWLGDYRASLDAYERAHNAFIERGDRRRAAMTARALAWVHGGVYGNWAVMNGWFGRAAGLLDELGEGSAPGWAALLRAWISTDRAQRATLAKQALDLADSFSDRDLHAEALSMIGEDLVLDGDIARGMQVFDEALAAITGTDIRDVIVLENVFCRMLAACERTADIERAEQWMAVEESARGRYSTDPGAAVCKSHFGGLLTTAGRWREAEEQLLAALRTFDEGYGGMRFMPIVRLAVLRVHQGRFDEAAQLLEGYEGSDTAHAFVPLHLARGNTMLAAELLERALGETNDDTSRAALLALAVDVALASNDIPGAHRAVAALIRIAKDQPTGRVRGWAAMARGKLCIAEGTDDARECLSEALSAFSSARMPLEHARARLLLARAVAAARPEVAKAEARSALERFEELSAARDADEAAAFLRSLGVTLASGARRTGTLTKRESEILALLGHGLRSARHRDA